MAGDSDDIEVAPGWEALAPQDIARFLEGFDAPWWIAGGWALDLFLGRQTRRHDDVDVAVLRRDQRELRDHLHAWDLRFASTDRTLEAWHGGRLQRPVHAIWARRSHAVGAPWTCEFLLQDECGGSWVFRRNAAITCPFDELGGERDGIPFLRPEVVLLFKSKRPRARDDNDFDVVREHLSQAGRAWLRRALRTCEPSHPWLRRLA